MSAQRIQCDRRPGGTTSKVLKAVFCAVVVLLQCCCPLAGDEVVFQRNGTELTLTGTILATAENGSGMLFQTSDGRIWRITAVELVSSVDNDEVIQPLTRKELGEKVRSELNDDFQIHEADEFVIVYNTSKPYARWVAGLYRRFERSFNGYWARNSFKPEKPEFPLAVIIFGTRQQYEQYMKAELGIVASGMIAYYNVETNRVAMYDLTADGFGKPSGTEDDRSINAVLNNPRAIPMVATIIHEGTHLLMFNNSMQTRFSDAPLWINEGLAMYFEVPDLGTTRGWRRIGQVNFLRLGPMLDYLKRRPDDSLQRMIGSDKPFRSAETADMYAQAWAFNYFLISKYQQEYTEYLKFISVKPQLRYNTEKERIDEFEQYLGVGLEKLDQEFVEFIRSLNR